MQNTLIEKLGTLFSYYLEKSEKSLEKIATSLLLVNALEQLIAIYFDRNRFITFIIPEERENKDPTKFFREEMIDHFFEVQSSPALKEIFNTEFFDALNFMENEELVNCKFLLDFIATIKLNANPQILHKPIHTDTENSFSTLLIPNYLRNHILQSINQEYSSEVYQFINDHIFQRFIAHFANITKESLGFRTTTLGTMVAETILPKLQQIYNELTQNNNAVIDISSSTNGAQTPPDETILNKLQPIYEAEYYQSPEIDTPTVLKTVNTPFSKPKPPSKPKLPRRKARETSLKPLTLNFDNTLDPSAAESNSLDPSSIAAPSSSDPSSIAESSSSAPSSTAELSPPESPTKVRVIPDYVKKYLSGISEEDYFNVVAPLIAELTNATQFSPEEALKYMQEEAHALIGPNDELINIPNSPNETQTPPAVPSPIFRALIFDTSDSSYDESSPPSSPTTEFSETSELPFSFSTSDRDADKKGEVSTEAVIIKDKEKDEDEDATTLEEAISMVAKHQDIGVDVFLSWYLKSFSDFISQQTSGYIQHVENITPMNQAASTTHENDVEYSDELIAVQKKLKHKKKMPVANTSTESESEEETPSTDSEEKNSELRKTYDEDEMVANLQSHHETPLAKEDTQQISPEVILNEVYYLSNCDLIEDNDDGNPRSLAEEIAEEIAKAISDTALPLLLAYTNFRTTSSKSNQSPAETSPAEILEQIKFCLKTAANAYLRAAKNIHFSIDHRHGGAGRTRATNLLIKLNDDSISTLEAMNAELKDLFAPKVFFRLKGNDHESSLKTFVLKELAKNEIACAYIWEQNNCDKTLLDDKKGRQTLAGLSNKLKSN